MPDPHPRSPDGSAAAPLLVVGAGQAGGQLVRQLLAGAYGRPIVLAGDEPHLPYERPPLSKAVLKGEAGEDSLALCPPEEWEAADLVRISGDAVVALDLATRRARFASGRSLAFGPLVLATGGSARLPPIPGAEHCQVLRTLDDSRALRAGLATARSVVIVGGGVIGLEVAATAAALGKSVTVLEAGPRPMARVLPPEVSAWLAAAHAAAGTTILTGVQVGAVAPAADGGFTVQARDATGAPLVLSADLVLAATGMVPAAGLLPPEVRGPAGGVLADALSRVPGLTDVFAIGDVAETENALHGRPLRLETWRNADRQARALARTLCGTPTPHSETPWMWTDQLGHNIQTVGLWHPGARTIARGVTGSAGSIVFWLEDGIVTGGVLVDAGRDRRFLEKLVETRAAPDPAALADPAVPLRTLA